MAIRSRPTPSTPSTAATRPRSTTDLLVGAALAYVAIAAILTGIAALALSLPDAHPVLDFPGSRVLGGWCRFDCTWYVDIASRGYYYTPGSQSSVAFFPGYPLLVRAVDQVVGSTPLAAIVVTWTAGLAAVLCFARWCAGRLELRVAGWAVACLLVYPYGWFLFGAGYADALFLALVIGAFLLLEARHPVLAGLVGAAAGVTRPIGVAVLAGLVLVALDRRGGMPARRPGSGLGARLGIPARIDLRAWRARDLGVFLAVLGPAAWSAWLASRFGDAFAYVTVQEAWDQKEGPHTWFKVGFGGQVLHGADLGYRSGLVVQALVVLVALLATPLVARRFGAGYGLFTLGVIVLATLGTKDFQGMGRYLLAAFPLFALAGAEIADRPRVRIVVVAVAGAVLAVGAFGFARNWYLT